MESLVAAPTNCLLVAQLIDSDEGEKKAVIEANLGIIADLVTLGLIKESTEEFKEVLDKVLKAAHENDPELTPRPYLVYTSTEIGNTMFGPGSEAIN